MSTFEALGLSGAMLETLRNLGFEQPTPIQEQAIPALLTDRTDLVALAQTGTGKTAAFGIPLIERVDKQGAITQALILAPTRELCMQITGDLNKFGAHSGVSVVPVYGGSSITEQIKRIRRGVQIIVATPGRLMDLMERGVIKYDALRFVVLDEADEMLNMGFKDDIDQILASMPEERNIWLFSATMPGPVRQIAKAYMRQPIEITVGNRNQANTNIEHQAVLVEERFRYDALKRILDFNIEIFGVVFCRTKIDTQRIAEQLMRDGYNADALHGDLTQQQRDRVMASFRNKTLQMLVATDVAARGIDVSNITHVIHYHLPDELEYYTHRSGRTARAGKKGISVAIVTRRESIKIKQIEKSLGIAVKRMPVPTGAEVCKQRLLNLVHRLREVKFTEEEFKDLMPEINQDLLPLSKEEIIMKFTALEFNHLLDYYRGAPDLNAGSKAEQEDHRERFVTGDRLFINLGKMDGLDKGRLLSLVCDRTGLKGRDIGKIELKGAYSFFEVDKSQTAMAREHLHGFEFKGRIVRVEVTGSEDRPAPAREKKYSPGKKHGGSGYNNYRDKGKPVRKSKGDDWFASKMRGMD